jgi:hypothetical protein
MADEPQRPDWHLPPEDEAGEPERYEDPALTEAQQHARQQRGERLRRALEAWAEVQSAEEQVSAWAEEHASQVEEVEAELREAFVDAAVAWLTEKWGTHPVCPYCGTQSWSVGTPFDVSLENGQALAPHFSAMCNNCGNTVFINAILAGLYPEPEEQ